MEEFINVTKQRAVWREEVEQIAPDRVRMTRIEVYYSLGGINYSSCRTEPRGYTVSIGPVEIIKRDGYAMESATAGAGMRRFLFPVARKSEKGFLRAVEMVKPHVTAMLEKARNVSQPDTPFADGEVYRAALQLIEVPATA